VLVDEIDSRDGGQPLARLPCRRSLH
jgi:hypothetical protein